MTDAVFRGVGNSVTVDLVVRVKKVSYEEDDDVAKSKNKKKKHKDEDEDIDGQRVKSMGKWSVILIIKVIFPIIF